MATVTSEDLNISLEPHLAKTLKPLIPLLPSDIRDQLGSHLSKPTPSLIPYSLLYAISQWTRTANGSKILSIHLPLLNPQDYTMVSLLAGTITSPERKFGDWVPVKAPEEVEAQRLRERKAITAIVNALLSIIGAGIATWWAADKTGWRNEWRVLLALFVAIVVAVSEGGLYLIWQSRRLSQPARTIINHEKDEDSQELLSSSVPDEATSTANSPTAGELRQRRKKDSTPIDIHAKPS